MMKKVIAVLAATAGLAVGAFADTYNLADVKAHTTFSGVGHVLTGKLGKNVKISLADGAKFTLRDVTINGVDDSNCKWAGLTCEGNATIILDGSNIIKGFYQDYPGIFVPSGKTLTIKGVGSLSTGSSGIGFASGIGGANGLPCGNIVIESGSIYAQAGLCAAGIGGCSGSCGDITINGGYVVAQGGYGLEIEGSDLYYDGGAGIGSADSSTCGNITITGGTVVAKGGSNAAGIGASSLKGCGNITISGGHVTAVGNYSAAGIGSSQGGSGNIIVSGGSVDAIGGTWAPGIGCGRYGSCANITIGSGVVCVAATPGVECDVEIGAGDSGICSGVTVDPSLFSMTSGRARIVGTALDLSLLKGDTTVTDGATLTGTLNGNYKVSIASGATVTLSKANIRGTDLDSCPWAGLTCVGSATIVLDGSNAVCGFYRNHPGIYVPSDRTLTVQGSGTLTARSNGNAAGIGGGSQISCGNIDIKGGAIAAMGGSGAAGIGGGSSAACGSVYIRSTVSRVTAVAGSEDANPIGKGKGGSGGSVSVASGLIDSTSGTMRRISPALFDLATLTGDRTFTDGYVLTGTLGGNYKISIADRATVTLSDATIEGANDNGFQWAGITCEGDATIVLEGENAVRGFYENYPGILVPYGSTLTIRGSGALDASSNGWGAGIGGGYMIDGGSVVIEGGTVYAKGGKYAAGIGGGYFADCGDISIRSGVVFVSATKGSGTAPNCIGGGVDATSAWTVTVDPGLNDSMEEAEVRIISTGDVSQLTGDMTFYDGAVLSGALQKGYYVSIADGATVTLCNLRIYGYNGPEWAGLSCEGDATIVLEGDNYVCGFEHHYPGIHVPCGCTLTIKGAGSLEARSNGYGAGIGGGWNVPCGNIVIEDGDITAVGGTWAAGIGGGSDGGCGDIFIKGGTITATGDSGVGGPNWGAGIGSGVDGSCGSICISGGDIIATGGANASGIGGARGGVCAGVAIENGIVQVVATCGTDCSSPIGFNSGYVTLDGKFVDKTVGKTRTLKPDPSAETFIVTFGKNGGTGGDNYVTATYGAAMPTPRTAPKLSGWTFAGYWDSVALDEKGNPKGKQYYDANMKSVRAWDKKSATTLWAKWTNKVTFGKNGGTGGDSYVTCTKGQPMPKRTMPTKSGYTFAGYWTTTGAGGVKYYNADGTSAHVWDKAGNVTLWAKWEQVVSVKVTFGKNGGTGGDDYVTATYGAAMPTPRTAPKRTGWTFGGYWDTLACDAKGNPLGKQYYNAKMESVRSWDKTTPATLWAKWTVRVTLGKNGGTGGDSYVTVIYGQPFPTRTMPKKSGYKFGGYFVSASSKTGQCYNPDGTGTSTMKWTTGGTPTIWALWTKAAGCVELPASPAAPSASAAPAIAEPAAIPAGLYSGVLADGSGAFWLMLDEPEEGYDRTAYIYIASEDGALTAECTVEESDGILVLTTEDGETFAVDHVAGTAFCNLLQALSAR